MPSGKRMKRPADTVQSKTMKGPANYPGESVQGAYGSQDTGGKMAGGGGVNLSPPNAAGMGNPMAGSGLPPAASINMDMQAPASPLPAGPPVDPGPAVRCPLPPGPNADPGMAAPSPLPPGPEDLNQGSPDTGGTPPGPPL